VGQDASVELQLSGDAQELAIVDLIGRRQPCEARFSATQRTELAEALGRMAFAAQRAQYSLTPARVPADQGGRVDVAALPSEVAIYVFRPGAWMSRSVHLAPDDARRLAAEIAARAAVGAND
jgi:hypothetical protein